MKIRGENDASPIRRCGSGSQVTRCSSLERYLVRTMVIDSVEGGVAPAVVVVKTARLLAATPNRRYEDPWYPCDSVSGVLLESGRVVR